MKKEELMIGDWVDIRLPDDEPGEHMYLQVEQLRECEIDADFETSYDNVYPIPLTPEILEKSGFEKTAESSLSKYYRTCLDENTVLIIECHVRANYVNIYCHPNGDTFGISASIENCKVHELQHVLKLCSIEKEILV